MNTKTRTKTNLSLQTNQSLLYYTVCMSLPSFRFLPSNWSIASRQKFADKLTIPLVPVTLPFRNVSAYYCTVSVTARQRIQLLPLRSVGLFTNQCSFVRETSSKWYRFNLFIRLHHFVESSTPYGEATKLIIELCLIYYQFAPKAIRSSSRYRRPIFRYTSKQ